MEIGTYLRKLRDSKEMSTRAVAEKIGVGQTTYMDWEHDKSSPSIKLFFKIADAFDTDPVELLLYLTGKRSQIISNKEQDIASLKETVWNLRSYMLVIGSERDLIREDIKKINEWMNKSTIGKNS